MAYTFRRASIAMAVTSSTTCVAFLANFFSPLMPFKSASLFAGVNIPVNYLLVIFFFPAVVVFYENRVKGRYKFSFTNLKQWLNNKFKKTFRDKVENFNEAP